MSDAVVHEAPAHPEGESTGIETRKLGMWFFLSSEFLFFGGRERSIPQ